MEWFINGFIIRARKAVGMEITQSKQREITIKKMMGQGLHGSSDS